MNGRLQAALSAFLDHRAAPSVQGADGGAGLDKSPNVATLQIGASANADGVQLTLIDMLVDGSDAQRQQPLPFVGTDRDKVFIGIVGGRSAHAFAPRLRARAANDAPTRANDWTRRNFIIRRRAKAVRDPVTF